ncbi:MAG: acyl transferase [Bacteroidota bacterium]
MEFIQDFKTEIFSINEKSFLDSSLALFDFQYHNNLIYHQYCNLLKRTPKTVRSIESIPFLPIEFFKKHAIKSSNNTTTKIFQSSGTTDTVRSKHYIKDLKFYHQVAQRIFEKVFGPLASYRIIALLPSYLEQSNSSLIDMVDYFIQYSKPGSGYFLDQNIENEFTGGPKTILFGVSYALLDLKKISFKPDNIVIETGGMKGRKKEMTRNELHFNLMKNFNISEIWSEYGMTELQSQAYGKCGSFTFPGWASAFIREINDPFRFLEQGKTGGINIIDLANIESCAFLETKDLGRIQKDNSFEVLGRFDNSDIRGCSLFV